MLRFSSFETRNLNVKFWICHNLICEVTKPKPLPVYEAEAEALSFWNHEAEAEAISDILTQEIR